MYEHIVFDGRRFVTFAEAAPQLSDRTLVVDRGVQDLCNDGMAPGLPAHSLIRAMARMQAHSLNPSSISSRPLTRARRPARARRAALRGFQARRDEVLPLFGSHPGSVMHAA